MTITYVGTLKDEIKAQYMKNRFPNGVPKCKRDALDEMMSAERREREHKEALSDLYSDTDNEGTTKKYHNDSDSSGNGTRFAHRTGVFSLDFPDSPCMPKGKGKRSTNMQALKLSLKMRESDSSTSDSDATTVMPTQTQELTITIPVQRNSDSDVVIQPSGFITERKKRRRSSSSRNKNVINKSQRKMVQSSKKGISLIIDHQYMCD